MGKFSNKFNEKVDFAKFFGVTGVRVVTNAQGVPYVNPTNEEMAEVFEDFKIPEEERKYTGSQKITWGYTALLKNGGVKRVSQKEYDEMSPLDREGVVVDEEVSYAKVSLIVETQDQLRVKKMMTFKFFKAPHVTKNGKKVKVYNKYGKTTHMSEDGEYDNPKFEHGEDDMVKIVPMQVGNLNFEDMLNFLYAYSSLSRKVALLDELDTDSIFEGDVSCISSLIMDLHEDIITSENKKGYGAAVLFTVENNKGTGNEFRQSYYNVFERWVVKNDGSINKDFSYILKSLAKERQPSKNGIVYSPESKGIFVGMNGIPKLGLKEFKNSYAEKMMSAIGSKPVAAPTPGIKSSDNNPFGGNLEGASFGDSPF